MTWGVGQYETNLGQEGGVRKRRTHNIGGTNNIFFFIFNCLLIKIKLTINFSLQPKLAFWSRTKYHEITDLFFITYLFWRDFELNVISKWNRMIYITLFSSHKSQRKIVKMCIIIFTWYLNIFDPGAWGWNGVLYL
jgi:hypothetical protein